jgi:hypothetical protein
MVGSDYVFYHVEQAIALLKGDPKALDKMDISADGFWRSFAAIVYSLPALIFTWAIGAHSPDHPGVLFSPVLRFVVDGLRDLGLWIAIAAIAIMALRTFGLEGRTAHFIVTRNWTTLLFNYIAALALIPTWLFGPQSTLAAILQLATFAFFVFGYVRITRMSLNVNVMIAAAIVLAEITLVLAVSIKLYPGL